jgi:Leucine-rich repeat (LRR) protein
LIDLALTNGASWTNHTIGWERREPKIPGTVTTDAGNTTVLLLKPEETTWSNLPASLGNLSGLQELDFEANASAEAFWRNSATRAPLLYLYSNQFSDIPQPGNLTNLQHLFLNSNLLTGTIPTELGGLTNLQLMSLSANDLTGSIPSSFGSLTSLTNLDLNDNQLSGSIPSSLGNLTNLESLYLYYNQLTGSIPPELGGLGTQISIFITTVDGEHPDGARQFKQSLVLFPIRTSCRGRFP